MKRLFAVTVVALLLVVAFALGVSVGRYEIFPFDPLRAAKQALFPPPSDDGFGPGYLRRLAILREMPGSPAVVMLGDSITSEGEWGELLPEVRIANRGIGGDSSGGVLARLSDILESSPEIVFVMIGYNDIDRGVPVSTIARNIEAILSSIHNSGATPIFQCTLHVGRDHPNRVNARVAQLNEAVLRFCVQAGISFLDLNSELAPDGYLETHYSPDGIHLTGEVYSIWAEHVRHQIEQIQEARVATN